MADARRGTEASSRAGQNPWRDASAGGSPAPDAMLAELLEALPDPVIGCDREGLVVLWSRAAEELYGYPAGEAMGKRLVTLLRTTAPRPLLEIREELLDLGRWEGLMLHRARSGEELTVQSRWVTRYDGDGSLAGAVVVERPLPPANVDPQPAAPPQPPAGPTPPEPAEHSGTGSPAVLAADAETQLRQTERLESLGQLAAGVAHDFNNALAIIINYAAFVDGAIERLHAAPAPTERTAMRADLAEIRAAAERAARLTQQLLAFSRQETGAPQPLSLNDVIAEIETLLAHTAGARVRLKLRLADDLSMVSADLAQLQQVLVNLTVNARDAMTGGGTLTIETDEVTLDAGGAGGVPDLEPGTYVRLRVSDTGAGMTPEVMRRAFDPFFTTKPRGHGTGLGLSSVYGIVTRAGGHARFFSQPGVGTTFVALLPVASPRDCPAGPSEEALPAAPVQPATVLLVEDDRPLREITRRILSEAGYEVIAAGGGAEALDLAERQSGAIDLLLTDVVMPGISGGRLADRVRALRPGVCVLYMSGFSEALLPGGDARTGDRSPDAPPADPPIDPAAVVDKPFTAAALLRQVAAALAAGARQDEHGG